MINENMANLIASDLLQIKAVSFSPNSPYTWASGIKSPIYTDNRLTIAYPRIREQIATGLANIIATTFPQVSVIGGVATAGIPHATLVSQNLNLPLIYVRSQAKDHGKGRQIEGQLQAGDQVILIDDLISTGGSVLKAVAAVRAQNIDVLGVAAIFSYQLPDAVENFRSANVPLVTLTDYDHLIQQATQQHYLATSDVTAVQQWRQDPWHWSL
ncbi:orotate phosphoribosyltransferase [Lapidilactobacillus dextrinicus DSM 20335]|uniref:Orotate phosphoribosyltransferase n=2 Tax=Lapidilactobacillus dextrinicus TaxID=51664 RepID=A0A0R2BJV6_9LACO|nr:orotate phosphoribosyltransferase [Lapidilactobacillus dextrinicus]KRM79805.1 orotate phosphoribosyltransferase [Lapidilactobacillus dextrinicus DSM 20335]QFG46409.1 orotate phosphoribosyltransferase [Lapidilactobacillus dextrinicus]